MAAVPWSLPLSSQRVGGPKWAELSRSSSGLMRLRVCQNSGLRLSFENLAFEKGLQRLGGVSGRVN
jgi:hypothetical protein